MSNLPSDHDVTEVAGVRALLQQPNCQCQCTASWAHLADIGKDVENLNLLQAVAQTLVQEINDAAT